MQEMRNCYDSLLSAAAATANSAYGNHLLPSCVSYGSYIIFLLIKPVCFLIISMWLRSLWYFSDQIAKSEIQTNLKVLSSLGTKQQYF